MILVNNGNFVVFMFAFCKQDKIYLRLYFLVAKGLHAY